MWFRSIEKQKVHVRATAVRVRTIHLERGLATPCYDTGIANANASGPSMVEARCVCASRKVPGRSAARRPPGQGTGCVDVRACVDTDAEPIDQLAAEPARYDREACADERENGCERRGPVSYTHLRAH